MRPTGFVLVLAASGIAACAPAQFTSGALPPAPAMPAARVEFLPPAPVLPAPALVPQARATTETPTG